METTRAVGASSERGTNGALRAGATAVAILLAAASGASAGDWDELTWLTSADAGWNEFFGRAVALCGDQILVGAKNDRNSRNVLCGSVFVFEGTGASWTQVAQLNPSDATAWQGFGFSMSSSGSLLLVGGPGSETADAVGSAYVFERTGSTWVQQAKLSVPGLADNDYYGWSVSISGDRAVVGAPGGGNFAPQGAAYVFEKVAGQWQMMTRLTAPGGAPGNMFGRSVAIGGDRILVGCPSEPTHDTAGAAYVIDRVGSVWQETAKLTPSDGQVDDSFGASVSLLGDRAAIGAPGDDDNGTYSGSGYIFELAGGTWHQTAKLVAAEGVAHEACGISIVLTDHDVLLGSQSEAPRDGSAYVFHDTGAGWQELVRLAAGGAGNLFGISVSMDETYAVIGTNRIGAYVFSTPEPATLSLLALGGLAMVRRRKR